MSGDNDSHTHHSDMYRVMYRVIQLSNEKNMKNLSEGPPYNSSVYENTQTTQNVTYKYCMHSYISCPTWTPQSSVKSMWAKVSRLTISHAPNKAKVSLAFGHEVSGSWTREKTTAHRSAQNHHVHTQKQTPGCGEDLRQTEPRWRTLMKGDTSWIIKTPQAGPLQKQVDSNHIH